MSTPDPSNLPPVESGRPVDELRDRWTAQYGPHVAARLERDRLYSLVRVGSAEYAFTGYDRFVRALRRMWDAQLMPETLPSVTGARLLDVVPNLRAVDPDLAELAELES
jgi:hypothetical protein